MANTNGVDTGADPDSQRVIAATEDLIAGLDPGSTPEQEFLEAQFDAVGMGALPRGTRRNGPEPEAAEPATRRILDAGGPLGGMKNPIGYARGPAVEAHGGR